MNRKPATNARRIKYRIQIGQFDIGHGLKRRLKKCIQMAINIYGVKFKHADLKGTDIEALHEFCRKNKIKGAMIMYQDDEGLNVIPLSYSKGGQVFINNTLGMLWENIGEPFSECQIQMRGDTQAIKDHLEKLGKQ